VGPFGPLASRAPSVWGGRAEKTEKAGLPGASIKNTGDGARLLEVKVNPFAFALDYGPIDHARFVSHHF
jgi:hypothetical protein